MSAAAGRGIRSGSPSRTALLLGVVLVLLALCFKASIRGDGIGYYAYLPTVAGNHSLDMRPTFDRFLSAGVPAWSPNLNIRLPNGLTANYKQVGSAVMAAPFYLLTQVALGITPQKEDPALSKPYQLAFTAASLFYAMLALLLLYRFVRDLWGNWSARLAVIAVTFTTPLVAYIFFEPSYSHSFSVVAITVFALFLYSTTERRLRWQWLALGVVGGVMVITHVQEILFLLLIPAEAIWLLSQRRWSPQLLPGYGLLAIGGLIGVLPQLLDDHFVYNRLLPPSAPNISFDFTHPQLLQLLFSTHHGWLSWSPFVLVALLGLPLVVRRLGWFAVALIAIGIGEVFLNASLSDWWGGLGFGSRRLTDQTLLLALGFGAAFEWLRSRRQAALAVAGVAAGVLWTVLLLANFYYIIRTDVGPSWHDFLLGQLQAIRYVPRLFIQGTVARDLATGQVLAGIATAVVLAGVLFGALWITRRLRPSRYAGSTGTGR
jgi:hypothetical protein